MVSIMLHIARVGCLTAIATVIGMQILSGELQAA